VKGEGHREGRRREYIVEGIAGVQSAVSQSPAGGERHCAGRHQNAIAVPHNAAASPRTLTALISTSTVYIKNGKQCQYSLVVK